MDADGDINDLIERHGRPRTQSYLQSLMRRSDAIAKVRMKAYFTDGPVADSVPTPP